jgi:hypothetical protein
VNREEETKAAVALVDVSDDDDDDDGDDDSSFSSPSSPESSSASSECSQEEIPVVEDESDREDDDEKDAVPTDDDDDDESSVNWPPVVVVAVSADDGGQRVFRVPCSKKLDDDLTVGQMAAWGPEVVTVPFARLLDYDEKHPYARLAAKVGIGRDSASWARYEGGLTADDNTRVVRVIHFQSSSSSK